MQRGQVKGTRMFGNRTYSKVPYQQLFEECYRNLEIKGRAEETLRTYKNHHKYFMEFLCYHTKSREPSADVITLQLLEDYILYLQNVRKTFNNTTINSYLKNVSPVIKYGVKRGYIHDDFPIPFRKVQEKIKEIYTQEELQSLLIRPKGNNFVAIRDWAIVWVLASTGVRSKELRCLKIKGVDLYNRSMTANHTKNRKARYLPISTSLLEVLEDYLRIRGGEGEDYLFPTVFGEIMSSSSLSKQIQRYCNNRGVEKTSLHLFRHTFITNSVNANVNPVLLQRVTGHSSMRELSRYYNSQLKDVVAVIDDIAPTLNRKESLFKKYKR
ncbi:tyrosine-type recombinase/integrase [Clostridium butyricum]|uniref:tyrosine-type recombinase/integrase n=1 Tax=Clostridium butyricum TaxID=1492 RepID=UPI0009037AAB|nr:site-specific integrase [Clostridium butyricum]APF23385.1 phage integrase family protein [Clostridium butyricum]